MYTVSRTISVLTFWRLTSAFERMRSRSVSVFTRRVSPLSLVCTVIVLVMVMVSCTSTLSTSELSLNPKLSTLNCSLCELLACLVLPHPAKHRTLSPIRAAVNAFNRIVQTLNL